MTAAYDMPFQMTDAESVLIMLSIVDDVTPSDYDWFYEIKGCRTLALTEGAGIVIDDADKTITIDPGSDFRLSPGDYTHGLLSVHKATGQSHQIFDGTGKVTRSPNS